MKVNIANIIVVNEGDKVEVTYKVTVVQTS